MNTTNDVRDPGDLERQASQIRADMDRTLEALERKFSPGQVLDRSVTYLRDHGGDLARNVGTTVKENPLPVLVAAAGIAWLFASSRRSRTRLEASADFFDDPRGDAYSTGRRLKEKVRSELHEGAEEIRDSLDSEVHSAGRRWRSSAASRRVSRAVDDARVRAEQAQQRARVLIDEQPLVLGALAIAAGAILGAVLPATQYENKTVGPVRDRTIEKAKELGQREYQTLRKKLEPRQDTQVTGRTN